jgi:hypothetical protein
MSEQNSTPLFVHLAAIIAGAVFLYGVAILLQQIIIATREPYDLFAPTHEAPEPPLPHRCPAGDRGPAYQWN